jgi:hypothetical protein
VYTVLSLSADPLTLLHKVSKCQHTTITMSHNLQCTQYCHFLLTHSHSCTKCPNANIQQSQCHTTYSVHTTVTSCWPTHTPAQTVQLSTHNNHNVTQFTVYTVLLLPSDPLTILHKLSNYQHTTVYFNLLLPYRKVVIKLFKSITHYECRVSVERNEIWKFRHVACLEIFYCELWNE